MSLHFSHLTSAPIAAAVGFAVAGAAFRGLAAGRPVQALEHGRCALRDRGGGG